MKELLSTHPFFADKNLESCTLLENQGYCNENYVVVADGVKYIVRKLLRDDIDRDLEWKIQHLAFKEKITAEPLVFDRENGFMVFAFLEGVHKGMEMESLLPREAICKSDGVTKVSTSESDLKQLAQTLQKLHHIHIDTQPIKLEIDSSMIDSYPKEYVLCHNDLNPNNIFFCKTPKLIDFEYAGVNDRYFDLASVCVEFDLDEKLERRFLTVYFDEEVMHHEKLAAYKVYYKAVCKAWFNDLEG